MALYDSYYEQLELYRSLQQYNTQREKSVFLSSYHTCETCLEEVAGHDMQRFLDCPHMRCSTCLQRMVEVHLQEGNVNALKCHTCGERLHPQNVRAVCSPE